MKVLTKTEIEYIYNTFIAVNNTQEYSNRYINLPLEKNNKTWRWEGKDFPRIPALLEFERYILKYDFKINNLLMINGDADPELDYLEGRVTNIHHIDYDKTPEIADLHDLKIAKDDFDFVCLHQTLEHVYNPYQCLLNVYKHMSKDGYLYINVPACNIPHSDPYHFYMGYSPMGLAALAYQAGFKILEIGQWGNKEYMVKNWMRQPAWPDYSNLQYKGLNEFDTPVITWGLFKK